MTERRSILKWPLYGLFLLVVFALQSSLGHHIAVFGVKPDLLPFFVASCAVLEGFVPGAWLGLLTGLLADAYHPVSEGFFAAYYTLFGLLAGYVTKKYLTTGAVTALLWGAAALVLSNACQYLLFHAVFERLNPVYLLKIAGIELLYGALLSPAVFWICRALSGVGMPRAVRRKAGYTGKRRFGRR